MESRKQKWFRKKSFIILGIASLTGLLIGQLNANLNSNLVGEIPGSFQVAPSGAATYTVNIDTPPGTAGMAPQLSLNYNSAGGNGRLGMGWSIGGLSQISRCNANATQDGYGSGITFTQDDRFCLDGQKLKLVSGAYGGDGAEYRTEKNGYSKIVSLGQAGSGPLEFKVYLKNGFIQSYGGTADSRVQASRDTSPGSATDLVSWRLNRSGDRAGNYMDYVYENPNSQDHHIKRIDYTGTSAGAPYNSVLFHYEARSASIRSFRQGDDWFINNRLQSIETQANSATVRRYNLSYDFNSDTKKERLASLELCDATGACAPATNFRFTNPTPEYPNVYQKNGGIFSLKFKEFADVNRDGYLDMLFHDGAQGKYLVTGKKNGKPSGEITQINRTHPVKTLTDINNDGSAELILNDPGSGRLVIVPGNGTREYAQAAHGVKDPNILHSDFLIGDVNGDGFQDLLTFSGGQMWIYPGTSYGSFNVGAVQHHPANSRYSYSKKLVDVNGDGIMDLVGYSNFYLYVIPGNRTGRLEIGNAVEHSGFAYASVYEQHFADVNGDGLTDYIGRYAPTGDLVIIPGSGTTGGVKKAIAQFDNVNARYVSNQGPAFTQPRVQFADMNGDGRADLVSYSDNPASGVYIALADHQGSFSQSRVTYLPNMGRHTLVQLMDLNNDGYTDFVSHNGNTDGKFMTQPNSAQFKQDLTVGADSGAGHKLWDVEYVKRSSDNLNYKQTGHISGARNLPFPLHGVARSQVSDGYGGQRWLEYSYQGLKTHVQGLGSLGVARLVVKDTSTGYVSNTKYYQDFITRRHSQVLRTKTVTGTGVTYKESFISYETKNVEGRFFVSKSGITSTEHTLANELVRTVTETMSYSADNLGNLTGNKSITSGATGNFTKDTVYTYHAADLDAWLTGSVSSITETKSASGETNRTLTTLLQNYHPVLGKPQAKILNAGSARERTQATTYDQFGNVSEVSVNGSGTPARTTTLEYDSRGQFLTAKINALGHRTSLEHEPAYGKLTKQTDPNGLVTTKLYDGLGRLKSHTNPDGVVTSAAYGFCEGSGKCQAGELFYSVVNKAEAEPSYTFFDEKSRWIRRQRVSPDGRMATSAVIYDTVVENGKELQRRSMSLPYYAGETARWTRQKYDGYGRVTQVTHPNGGLTTHEYPGLDVITTNPKGQTSRKNYDVAGRLIESVDHAGSSVTYKYDALGNAREIKTGASTIVVNLDGYGYRTSLNDPNIGLTGFISNVFGQIVSRTDAKGKTICMAYDQLGRMSKRIDNYQGGQALNDCTGDESNPSLTVMTYDQGNKAVGKISHVSMPNGYVKEFTYDNAGRVSELKETIEGETFVSSASYDVEGRLQSKVYPGGFAVKYEHDSNGFRTAVRLDDADNNDPLLWSAGASNAAGQMQSFTLGNGVETTRTYDANTLALMGIQSVKGTAKVQDLHYLRDELGNIRFRQDLTAQFGEKFDYDNLNRLTQVTPYGDASLGSNQVDQAALTSGPAGVQTANIVNVAYDAMGNITHKSDVGDYTYGQSAGPHAVTGVSGLVNASYTYDTRGNMTGGDGRSIQYTDFNKVAQVQKGALKTGLFYGAERARTRRVDSENEEIKTVTTYVGKHYEKVEKNGFTQHRYYVGGFAVVVRQADLPDRINYMHRDHLGSLTALTDEIGGVIKRYSFDAWGKRRDPDALNPALNFLASLTTPETERGYTNHEHLDGVGLIHMNGRVYEPQLARFTSPDPFVQSPDLTQNMNRYSYVLNNPMGYTDPSGYKFRDKFKKFFKETVKNALVKVVTSKAFQIIMAVGEILGGVAACATGVGCAAGMFAIVHGLDSLITTAKGKSSLAVRGLMAMGLNEKQAGWVDMALSMGAGKGLNALSKGLRKSADDVGKTAGKAAAKAGKTSAQKATTRLNNTVTVLQIGALMLDDSKQAKSVPGASAGEALFEGETPALLSAGSDNGGDLSASQSKGDRQRAENLQGMERMMRSIVAPWRAPANPFFSEQMGMLPR